MFAFACLNGLLSSDTPSMCLQGKAACVSSTKPIQQLTANVLLG